MHVEDASPIPNLNYIKNSNLSSINLITLKTVIFIKEIFMKNMRDI